MISSRRAPDPPPVTIKPPFGAPANAVIARSTSPASRKSIELTSTPNDGATPWIAPNWAIEAARLSRTAARVTRGAISFSSSSHFAL
jgi:hypothetical protein